MNNLKKGGSQKPGWPRSLLGSFSVAWRELKIVLKTSFVTSQFRLWWWCGLYRLSPLQCHHHQNHLHLQIHHRTTPNITIISTTQGDYRWPPGRCPPHDQLNARQILYQFWARSQNVSFFMTWLKRNSKFQAFFRVLDFVKFQKPQITWNVVGGVSGTSTNRLTTYENTLARG